MANIDVSMFFNEFDILRLRLEELYPVVDQFVIIENNRTLRGDPKPYYLSDDVEVIRPWLDKITVMRLEDEGFTDPWVRESWQRNSAVHALAGCDPDDCIIFADVDEIPRQANIEVANPSDVLRLELRDYSVGINLWNGGYISIKMVRASVLDTMTPQAIRKLDDGQWMVDAGWHFSSIASPEMIQHKLKSFSHSEIDVPGISDLDSLRRRINDKEDIAGRGFKLAPVRIDATFPEGIQNNREYWSKYEWAV